MPSEISTQASVTIEAPSEDVWKALTTPELIKQWFFGVDTVAEWRGGGSIAQGGVDPGRPYAPAGPSARLEPGRLLVHTHWSPVSGLPDRPENYQEVTWALSGYDGRTELTVTERNLPSEQAKEASDQGWQAALAGLKKVVERTG